MFEISVAIALSFAAFQADPLSVAANKLDKCLHKESNKQLAKSMSTKDFRVFIKTICEPQKSKYVKALTDFEIESGANRTEAVELANDDLKVVLGQIIESYADMLTSNTQFGVD